MRRRAALVLLSCLALLLGLTGPAAADHTNPNAPLTPTPADGVPGGEPAIERGIGEWEHLRSFPNNIASDVTFFTKGSSVYAAQGTLGQGPRPGPYVGQRIVELMRDGAMLDPPVIRADHGSAQCFHPASSATGLQHDSFATPPTNPEILTDTTDAPNRCHDTPTGGIELIDISNLNNPEFEPREIHLLRFNGNTHTTTLDSSRPWIIYSNNSDFANSNWLDFADIRSCLTQAAGGTLPNDADLERKRADCRPVVYRIPFEDVWTQQTTDGEPPPEGDPASCHDTVVVDDVIYCSGIRADVLIDISGMFNEDGSVKGDPLPCTVVDAQPGSGVETGAMVTDCNLVDPAGEKSPKQHYYEDLGAPQAAGWSLLGFYNHPGISHGNNNYHVPATEGVAVSHETRPFPKSVTGDRDFIVVSDERGGGVVPGGANCSEDNLDPYSNGGLHVLDVTDPSNITYATMLDEDGEERKAVWRGHPVVPQPTFCVVHRFRFLEDEQRIVMGYYSQGMKVLDYDIDEAGRFTFEEVASFQFKDSITWTADVFHIVDNPDGTRTYHIAMSDTLDHHVTGNFVRGLDVLTWTAEPNPIPGTELAERVARIRRLWGDNRFETAADISRERFGTAETVFLSRADDYADALAGAPLAHQRKAPMLLTWTDRLTPQTEEEIDRLNARTVVLLGRENAISPEVEQHLRDKGLQVERIGASNRFGTAQLIAAELDPEADSVLLAEGIHADPGRGWPDAVSAAPFAAFTERPILLAARDHLPRETAQALERLGVSETIMVGGPSALSERVEEQVRDSGHGPERVFGSTRYGTSRAVFDLAVDAGMDPDDLWLATGRNWPDALAAGPAVSQDGGSLLLVDGQDLDGSPPTRDLIAERAESISRVTLLGGPAAISQRVEDQVRELLGAEEEADDGAEGGGLLAGDAALVLTSLTMLPIAALVGRRRRRRAG